MKLPAPDSRRASILLVATLLLTLSANLRGQAKTAWRAATATELEAALPDRALVGKERIETEMRTASGVADGRGHLIAAVVLITAGYAADGQYSHYLLLQSPITLAGKPLPSGTYVVGWSRQQDGLSVHVFDSDLAKERATVLAVPNPASGHVESFRIWPPGERSVIQIGRYILPYKITP